MRRLLCVLALAGVALALPLTGVSASPPSAEDFYARAVEQMRNHPDPAFATYDASLSGLNCRVTTGGMECTLGRSTPESEKPFPVDLRQSDGRVALNPQDRHIVLGDSTFLNPTWVGVDKIIRRGFMGRGRRAIDADTEPIVFRPPGDRGRISAFLRRLQRLRCRRLDLRDWRFGPCSAFVCTA